MFDIAPGGPEQWYMAGADAVADLQPGQDLPETWELADDSFVLLPAPGTEGQPAQVVGLAWSTSELRGWRVDEQLEAFAARVPGARVVMFGVGIGYCGDQFPALLEYNEKGFHMRELPTVPCETPWPVPQRFEAVLLAVDRIPAEPLPQAAVENPDPVSCAAVHTDCTAQPVWQVRQVATNTAALWRGACSEHLALVCAAYPTVPGLEVLHMAG